MGLAQCTFASSSHIRKEEEEVLLVHGADAVVDPGTVMIHLHYAPVEQNSAQHYQHKDGLCAAVPNVL